MKQVGGDYDEADFDGGSSTTSIPVTDLKPGKSYLFQIRARNDNSDQNSDWSASIPIAITTKQKGTEPANLSIHSINGFDGSEPLIVGKSYHYNVCVVNKGLSRWKGAFYLKDGDNDLMSWGGISLSKDWAQDLEFDYIPKSAGTQTLTLYYQTGMEGDGIPVSAGNAKNPMTIKINSDPLT